MASYKLTYFDCRGRAELIRMMFTVADFDFVDERIHHEDWPKRKADAPFGCLPVLHIGDKPLPHSLVIVRYLAKCFNLEPCDSVKAAFMDAFVCTLDSLVFKLPYMEESEEKKKKALKHALENDWVKVFEKLDKVAKKHGGQFMDGDTLCYGDLALLVAFENIYHFNKTFPDRFPRLKEIAERVMDNSKIAKYMKKRPKTKF